MYARIHQEFVDQPFRSVGLGLIAAQAAAILLLLGFGDLGERWPIVIYQVLGIGAIYFGVRQHEAGRSGDRLLVYAGALALIVFLYIAFAPLGALALIIWGIVFLISIVT
jgi:hypothetical protein